VWSRVERVLSDLCSLITTVYFADFLEAVVFVWLGETHRALAGAVL
jgi:hypothetical protein